MSVFKKTLKYSKSSRNLEEKIKNLDEDLKKTGVLHQEGSILYSDPYKNQIQINEESNFEKGDRLYDWRKSFISEHNPFVSNDEVLESNITEEYVEEIREKHRKLSLVENSIEEIKVREAQNIFQELYQDQVEQVVEKYVSYHSKDIISLREDLFLELKKKPTVDISSLEEKINLLTLKYKKLSEGLLNDPLQNSDPLTQSPVTIEQLKNHYQLLVSRLQEQLATLGGGGEVRLKYLDDIVGIATNASAYGGKFLKYNHSLGKFEFDTVGELYWDSTATGIHTLSSVGIGTTNPTSALTVKGNTSLETLNVSGVSTFASGIEVIGSVTATSFIGDGSGLIGIVGSGSGIVVLNNGLTVGTAGTIDFGDNFTVSPISSGVVTVTSSGGTSSQWVTTATGIHTLSNVGVGTTIPTSPLTVVGNASISGQTNTNSLSVAGTTVISELTVVSNSTFNGNLNVGLVGSLNIGVDGFNPNGDLQVYKDFGTNNSIIKYGGTDNFYVLTDNLSIRNSSSTYNKADFSSTTVKLYAGGAGGGIKFETLGVGVTVTGTTFTNQLSVSGTSTFSDDVIVGVNTSSGVILTSANGTQYRLIVDDGGALSTVLVS